MTKGNDEGDGKKVINEALGDAATEFKQHSTGTGKALGKATLTAARTVEVLLSPFTAIVWGYDKIAEEITPRLQAKLKNVPDEQRQSPDPMIAGPAIEALRFAGHNEDLRDLFENVLATAIDTETATNAHPSFVEIIKQLSADECKVIRYMSTIINEPILNVKLVNKNSHDFRVAIQNVSRLGTKSGCNHMNLVQGYIDNLCRLEICAKYFDGRISDDSAYRPIIESADLKEAIEGIINHAKQTVDYQYGYLTTTMFGNQFINACVIPKS